MQTELALLIKQEHTPLYVQVLWNNELKMVKSNSERVDLRSVKESGTSRTILWHQRTVKHSTQYICLSRHDRNLALIRKSFWLPLRLFQINLNHMEIVHFHLKNNFTFLFHKFLFSLNKNFPLSSVTDSQGQRRGSEPGLCIGLCIWP